MNHNHYSPAIKPAHNRKYYAEFSEGFKPGFLAIYTLNDPDSLEVKYVGCTKQPDKRLKKHVESCSDKTRKFSNKKDKWVENLLSKGKMPILTVLNYYPEDQFEFWEQYWICQFKSWGFDLVNSGTGGKGSKGYVVNEKAVLKKDLNGNIIKSYKRVDEAAKEEGIGITAMSKRISRKSTKNGFIFEIKTK